MQGHMNEGTKEKDTGFPLTTGGNDRGGGGGQAYDYRCHSRARGESPKFLCACAVRIVSFPRTWGVTLVTGHWPFSPLTPALSRKGEGGEATEERDQDWPPAPDLF